MRTTRKKKAYPSLDEIGKLADNVAETSDYEQGTLPGKIAKLSSWTALYFAHHAEREARRLQFLTFLLVFGAFASAWVGWQVQRSTNTQTRRLEQQTLVQKQQVEQQTLVQQQQSALDRRVRACALYEQQVRAYISGDRQQPLLPSHKRKLDAALPNIDFLVRTRGYAALAEYVNSMIMPRFLLERFCPPS